MFVSCNIYILHWIQISTAFDHWQYSIQCVFVAFFSVFYSIFNAVLLQFREYSPKYTGDPPAARFLLLPAAGLKNSAPLEDYGVNFPFQQTTTLILTARVTFKWL